MSQTKTYVTFHYMFSFIIEITEISKNYALMTQDDDQINIYMKYSNIIKRRRKKKRSHSFTYIVLFGYIRYSGKKK